MTWWRGWRCGWRGAWRLYQCLLCYCIPRPPREMPHMPTPSTLDYEQLAVASTRGLLLLLLTRQDDIMAKLTDIAQTEAADKDALAALTTDLAAIKTAITTTLAAQQAKLDQALAANATLTTQIADLQAGDALTQTQIDALATASSDNSTATTAAKAAGDALLAQVSGTGGGGTPD